MLNIRMVDKCSDHPENIAVDNCKECSKYICGLHPSGYCLEHANIAGSEKTGKSAAILFVIFSISIVVFVGSLLASFLAGVNDVGNGNGVVTIQSDTITISDTSVIPDAGTLLFIALGVAIPILITVALVLIRVAQAAKGPSVTIKESDQKDIQSDNVFYCQSCGSKLQMSDTTCPSCGKDISEEKRFVS